MLFRSLSDGDKTSEVTFTFSDATSDFVVGDVTVSGGTLSNFAGSGSSYTATFTADDALEGTGTVTVAAGSYTDAAGNAGTEGSDTVTIDTLGPSVTITLDDTELTTGETTMATFTFSEAPSGFTIDDVTAPNGTLSGFTVTVNANVFVVEFTPDANIEAATNVISVGADYIDAAGNAGTAGVSANYSINTTNTVDTLIVVGTQIVIRGGNVDLFSVPADSANLLDVSGDTSDNVITLDYSGGSVIPPGGLKIDGGGGLDTLRVTAGEVDLDFTDGGGIAASNFTELDLTDADAQIVTLNAAAVTAIAPSGRLLVRGGQDDSIRFDNRDDWRMGETSVVEGRFVCSIVNVAGGEEVFDTELPLAWQNVVNHSDVNNNGEVTAGDALIIINELARRRYSNAEGGLLEDPLTVEVWPGLYYDQSGDEKATALDALRVINELARLANQSNPPSGEFVEGVLWASPISKDWRAASADLDQAPGVLNADDDNAANNFASPAAAGGDYSMDHFSEAAVREDADWEATLQVLSEDAAAVRDIRDRAPRTGFLGSRRLGVGR